MHIIATIGPRSNNKMVIKELIENGVDILRLNCSHFDKEFFEKTINYSKALKKDIHILVDLCGKKIRISKEFKYIYTVYNGQEVYFCGEDYYKKLSISKLKEKTIIPLNIDSKKIIKSNIQSISMKDNTMKFEIMDIKDGIIKTKVLNGGVIREGKGCNISKIYNDENELNKNDEENIVWALKNNVDIICQSFVESKNDIRIIKDLIDKNNKKCEVWAKVETPVGIKNLKEIIEEVDTIVIGRGDLVPESGILDSINLQNEAIRIIKKNNKKVIIATHLLNSMKNGNLATLPELESIYNFININVDGFLLAGETSIGRAPIKTVDFLKTAIDYYMEYKNE